MPKIFQFSLQKVLDVRKHKEDQKAIELGKAKTRLDSENIKLDNLHETKQNLISRKGPGRLAKPNLLNIKMAGSYLLQLSDGIMRQKKEVKRTEKDFSERRGHLMEAVKDRKIVEKLKERKFEEYRKQVTREMAKKDDEVAGRMVNQKEQDN